MIITPKEKAEELYEKFDNIHKVPFKNHEQLKECTLIVVEEILNLDSVSGSHTEGSVYRFWCDVKSELEKI